MDIEKLIRSVQKELGVEVDGKAGPQTWTAIAKRLIPDQAPSLVSTAMTGLDARSKKNIETLLPEVQPYAVALIQKAALNGIQAKVISGHRTYAEQDALYAKGRPDNGPKVTNAKGGQSNHNFGIAFDIGIFEGTDYLGSSPKYKALGLLGMDLGLDWGGNWKSFKDQPHFQLRPSWANGMNEKEMLAELRKRKSEDQKVFV
ncbi:M15 family metallopeptidase [Pseudomonas sp. G(2018)]|uniref:M15 family metallopeptidase n=1 Tax=Pseudomonas sp. G(2018) TaxID=2502242 RepID=UPI0010F4B563|nr:M15 family metallopeptidase [Pseudomonas sp. G(2018)]